MKKHFHIHIKEHAGIFAKAGKDPYADWFIILLFSTALAVIFIYFAISLFLYIDSDTASLAPSASAASIGGTLDKPDLEKLIADFQNKQSRTALFESGYQGAPDPSGTVASATSATLPPTAPTGTGAPKPGAKPAPATLTN